MALLPRGDAGQFGVSLKSKRFFFDRATVHKALERSERIGLSQAGAFIRRRARSSQRRRKRISTPGQPPSVHSTDPYATLKNIWFIFDKNGPSVVIGPTRLPRQARYMGLGPRTVPELHEFGGQATIRQEKVGRRWLIARGRPGTRQRSRRARYLPRPFMGPALLAEADKIPRGFKGSFGP